MDNKDKKSNKTISHPHADVLKTIKANFKHAQLNVETKTYVLVLTEFTAFIPSNCLNCKVDELIVNSTVSLTNGRTYVRVQRVNNAVISWEL